MIYIAAPFFNPAQVAAVSGIEEVLEEVGLEYYSPRKEGVLTADAPTEERRRIFASNIAHISSDCTLMLATTPYISMRGTGLYVCSTSYNPPCITPKFAINQPDTGTVFEVGAAWAMGIPLVAYHPDEAGADSLNIMLAEAFDGFVSDMDQLRQLSKHLIREHRSLLATETTQDQLRALYKSIVRDKAPNRWWKGDVK